MQKILKVLTHTFDSMLDLLQKASCTTSQVDQVEGGVSFQKACIKKIPTIFWSVNYNVKREVLEILARV